MSDEANEVNGSAPPDDPIIESLRKRVEVKEADFNRLRASLTKLETDLKRDQKALAILKGETLGAGGRPPSSTQDDPGKPARVRDKPSGLSEERLKLVSDAILRLAKDSDEFRQIDVRGIIDVTSGVTALGFEELRRRGVIRLSRQSGNNKFYRLTREELARQAEQAPRQMSSNLTPAS